MASFSVLTALRWLERISTYQTVVECHFGCVVVALRYKVMFVYGWGVGKNSTEVWRFRMCGLWRVEEMPTDIGGVSSAVWERGRKWAQRRELDRGHN